MSLSVQMRRPFVIVNDDAGIINRGIELLAEAAAAVLQPFDTIAEMTATSKSGISDGAQAFVSQIDNAGVFVWDAASTETENGGTVFESDEGGAGRWVKPPFSFQETIADLPFNPGGFGGLFLSGRTVARIEMNTPEAADIGPRFNLALTANVEGGHANGPGSAKMPLWVMVRKNNPLTSTKTGEIDGGYILVQQGSQSDAGGLLIDATKTFGSGSDTGGLTTIEMASKRVNPAGVVTDRIQTIFGFQEGVGGFTQAAGTSVYAEAQAGSPFAALAVVGRSDIAGSPNFQHIVVAGTSRNPASVYFKIDGAGVIHSPNGSAAAPSLTFLQSPDMGLYRVNSATLGVTTDGVARALLSSAGFVPATNAGLNLGGVTARFNSVNAVELNLGTTSTNGMKITHGAGSPEGVVTANVGSQYMRRDGGAGTTLYVKESGTGNTGWVAK
jgi:hypothetical protein